MQRRISRVEQQVAEWQAKAELALNKDREDLARAALMEKQKSAELATSLNEEMAQIEEQLDMLKNEIQQLQTKLDDARARQKAMVMRKETASSRLKVKKQLDSQAVQSSIDKFENYERRIDDVEAQVESYDMGKKSLQDEFAELAAQDEINSELEALKKKMQQSDK